jgi:hypothetical protein
VDYRLELHVVVEDAPPIGRQVVEIGPHPRLADIDAAPGQFQGALLGEEVGRLVPQTLVHIIAIGRLQVTDGLVVAGRLRLRLQGRMIGAQLGQFAPERGDLVFDTHVSPS